LRSKGSECGKSRGFGERDCRELDTKGKGMVDILPADEQDHDALVALYREHRFALQEREWFDWKFFGCPGHRGTPYKVLDEGTICGANGILPQTFRYAGKQFIGLQTVDGLMGRTIRGKGLFNNVHAFMERQNPDGLEQDYFYFCCAAVAGSVKAIENAGWRRLLDFSQYTCILDVARLRTNPKLARFTPLLQPAWPLFRKKLFQAARASVRIEPIARFSTNLDYLQPQEKVCGDRSASFLNWRVIDNPRDDMSSFGVYEDGGFVGYFVCKNKDRCAEIVDSAFVNDDPAYLASLLQYLHTHDLADSVDLMLLGQESGFATKPSFGFLERKAVGSFFIHGAERAGLPSDPKLWNMSYLDTDW
jgi:hypothetical protein